MKHQIHIFWNSVLLFLFLAPVVVLHGASIPEPVLPLREAGEYVPRIEELKKMLKANDAGHSFSRMAKEMIREIKTKQDVRCTKGKGSLRRVSTRAEFAALEWIYYLTIFCSYSTPKDHWNGVQENFYSSFGFLSAESAEFLAEQKIDSGKLHHLRATYRAILLKKLRAYYEEFEDEYVGLQNGAIAGRLYLKRLQKYEASWSVPRKFTEEERNLIYAENSDFDYKKSSIGRISNVSKWDIESTEKDFLYDLLFYFGKTPSALEPYIKLAGYDTEAKRADLLLRMQKKSLEQLSFDSLFAPYAAKIRFNPVEAKKLALREKERVAKELEKRNKKWETRLKALQIEYNALLKETTERFEKCYKKNPSLREATRENPFEYPFNDYLLF